MRPLGAELFHADSHTGMTKLTVAFRNSANAPKIWVRNCQINVNGWLGIMKCAMMVYTIKKLFRNCLWRRTEKNRGSRSAG